MGVGYVNFVVSFIVPAAAAQRGHYTQLTYLVYRTNTHTRHFTCYVHCTVFCSKCRLCVCSARAHGHKQGHAVRIYVHLCARVYISNGQIQIPLRVLTPCVLHCPDRRSLIYCARNAGESAFLVCACAIGVIKGVLFVRFGHNTRNRFQGYFGGGCCSPVCV